MPMRLARAAALAFIACGTTASAGRAQGAPSAIPVGAASVTLDGSALVDPMRAWSVGGVYLPFVASRWQVGVAPRYAGSPARSPVPAYNALQVAGVANYLVPLGRGVHGYVGGYAERAEQWGGPPGTATNTFGAQAGALRFVGPAAALRAEARYRRADRVGAPGITQVVVILDRYVGGAAPAGRWTAPALGAADVDLAGSASWSPGATSYYARLALAPFVARWAQLGGRWQGSVFDGSANTTAYEAVGFARLYAPLAGRTTPFAEGYVTSSTFGSDGGGLSSYGAVLGVRRYVGPNTAFDLGVAREERPPIRAPGGWPSLAIPGTTTLRLGVVTHLRRGG